MTGKGPNDKGKSKAPGKGKTPDKGKAEMVPASPTDVLRAATVYLKKVAAGDEAITNQRIAFVKALARDCAAIIKAEAAAAAKAAKPGKDNLGATLNAVLAGKLAGK